MRILFLLSCLFLFKGAYISAQTSDCFHRLLNRGIEEFNAGNFEQARLKWETAKTDCPNVTYSQQQTLNEWIAKTNLPTTSTKDTVISLEKVKVVVKTETVEKIVYRDDTVFVENPVEKVVYREKIVEKPIYVDRTVEKIVYKDKIVEKTVYVDKPIEIEKIVYRDRPEPYHKYGKGHGHLTIFTSVDDGGMLSVWIDGEQAGSTDKYYPNTNADCGALGAINKIVLQGSHHIVAKNQAGRRWEFYTVVDEDNCKIEALDQRK